MRRHCSQQYDLSGHRSIWRLLVLVVLTVTAFGQTGPRLQRGVPPPKSDVVQTNTKSDGYVGSQTCGGCHVAIYREFSQTKMGRSISSISLALLQELHVPARYFNQRLDRHYEVAVRDGKVYESEFAQDVSGKEIFREEHQLQWIVGSGANGLGAIVRRGDYLFEAPLTFYTSTKT